MPCCAKGGLSTGTPYHFRVRAGAGDTWGPWTEPSAAVAPAHADASAPSRPRAKAIDGASGARVAVAWAPPAAPAAPVRDYLVQAHVLHTPFSPHMSHPILPTHVTPHSRPHTPRPVFSTSQPNFLIVQMKLADEDWESEGAVQVHVAIPELETPLPEDGTAYVFRVRACHADKKHISGWSATSAPVRSAVQRSLADVGDDYLHQKHKSLEQFKSELAPSADETATEVELQVHSAAKKALPGAREAVEATLARVAKEKADQEKTAELKKLRKLESEHKRMKEMQLKKLQNLQEQLAVTKENLDLGVDAERLNARSERAPANEGLYNGLESVVEEPQGARTLREVPYGLD